MQLHAYLKILYIKKKDTSINYYWSTNTRIEKLKWYYLWKVGKNKKFWSWSPSMQLQLDVTLAYPFVIDVGPQQVTVLRMGLDIIYFVKN